MKTRSESPRAPPTARTRITWSCTVRRITSMCALRNRPSGTRCSAAVLWTRSPPRACAPAPSDARAAAIDRTSTRRGDLMAGTSVTAMRALRPCIPGRGSGIASLARFRGRRPARGLEAGGRIRSIDRGAQPRERCRGAASPAYFGPSMAPDDFPAGGYWQDYAGFWVIWAAVIAVTWGFFRATRGRKGKLRLVAGNLLVTASLLWTLLLVGETYLRYVYDQTDSYGLTLTNWSWFKRHVDGKHNSDGFRDAEFTAANTAGVTRVDCVGDSFTFGWGIKETADCWPQRIDRELALRAPGRYRVRNFGVIGLTTGGEADIVDRIAERGGTSHVILGYCLNDPDDLMPPDTWFRREDQPRVPFLEPTTSFVADFFWFRFKLARDPRVAGYFDWEVRAYEDPQIFGKQCERFRRIA